MKRKSRILLGFIWISALMVTSCKKLDPNAPEACFVLPDEIVAGVPALFNSSCSVNGITFSWDFGDGDTSAEANPSHTYAQAGSYVVTLVVTNDQGKTDEESVSITVQQPAVIEHSGNIEDDETWIEGTHLVTSDVYVDGAILTIAPGATVMFAAGRGLYIGFHSGFSGATLIADGTADKPITFTSAASTKSPGDWDFIGFYDGASNVSSMTHCTVEYGGGYSSNYGEVYVDGSAVSIEQSTFRYTEFFGISLSNDGFFESFTGNTMRDLGSAPIQIYANYAHTIGTGNDILTTKGILVKGDDIEQENATWKKQSTAFVIDSDIYVGSGTGANLTIDPGVEIRLTQGAGIYVGFRSGSFGTLMAEGTADDRITFTSSAPDVAKSPGDWDFLGFYSGAGVNSSLAYCDFEYGGGYSSTYGMVYLDESAASITDCSFSDSETMGISLRDDAYFTTFTGNTFQDNGDVPLEVYSNYAHTIGTGNTFNTGPGIRVEGDDIVQTDVTWLMHNVPYILDGDSYVGSNSGSTLTIQPGAVLKFTEGTAFYVGFRTGTIGVLVADGDPGTPVTFTSGAPSGFESAGDWEGIWFEDGTGNGTILDNCVISYGGGYSSNSGNLNIRNDKSGIPVISNCQITNSAAWGIYLRSGADPTLTDNIFGNNVSGDTNM